MEDVLAVYGHAIVNRHWNGAPYRHPKVKRRLTPSGLRPSSFVMANTPVEVQSTSAGCLNYPCRTSANVETDDGAEEFFEAVDPSQR